MQSEVAVSLVSTELVNTILGAGGLAFLYAIGKAISWMLDRASAREDKVEKQNDRWQREMYRRLTFEAKQHDWWRNYGSQCESIIIRELGKDALPEKRPYPREPDDEKSLKALEP